MKFNKILVVYSEKLSEKHKKTVDKVKKISGERICSAKSADNLSKEDFKDIDLAITIGGDGAFIRAAAFLKDTPILGINSEPEFSEGALLSLEESELKNLKGILEGNFKILKRERIKARLNGTEIEQLALNDVYIGSANQFHTSRYIIKFKEDEEEQRSSGVLISTNSGSSAWYKSSGGTPFSENNLLKFIVREPFFRKIFQPKILHGEIKRGEKIEFESTRHTGGVISLDSNYVREFNFGDKVEIEISETPLKVIEKTSK